MLITSSFDIVVAFQNQRLRVNVVFVILRKGRDVLGLND